MSSPGIRLLSNKTVAGPNGKARGPQALRVMSDEGVAPAAAPSVVMPRAKTDLGELLAGDRTLCLRRTSAPAPQAAEARPVAASDDSGAHAEPAAALAGQETPGDGSPSPSAVHVDGDLARVIKAWPGLPCNVRAAVLALVR